MSLSLVSLVKSESSLVTSRPKAESSRNLLTSCRQSGHEKIWKNQIPAIHPSKLCGTVIWQYGFWKLSRPVQGCSGDSGDMPWTGKCPWSRPSAVSAVSVSTRIVVTRIGRFANCFSSSNLCLQRLSVGMASATPLPCLRCLDTARNQVTKSHFTSLRTYNAYSAKAY